MNTLIKATYTEASLARTFMAMQLTSQSCKLLREFELIKAITEDTPEVATQRLIQRSWDLPPNTTVYSSLYQYATYVDEGGETQYSVMLCVHRDGARIVEVTAMKLNEPRSTTHTRFLGDRDLWDWLIDRSGKILDESITYSYPNLLKSDETIRLVGPVTEGTTINEDVDKGYNPRYNTLLDKSHLDTSDNQHDMVEVVHRFVNGINWLSRARTDRPYIHLYRVEGYFPTDVKLILFPDRSKIAIVKRFANWDSDDSETWIGVNPYNETTKAYLEKAGLSYDTDSYAFVNPDD